MIPLEYFVRPWLNTRKSVNAKPPVEPLEGDAAEATLVWGSPMPTQVDTFSPTVSVTIEENKETQRVTRNKRVENPDDASQFVDVEVIDEIYFKDNFGKAQKFKLENG